MVQTSPGSLNGSPNLFPTPGKLTELGISFGVKLSQAEKGLPPGRMMYIVCKKGCQPEIPLLAARESCLSGPWWLAKSLDLLGFVTGFPVASLLGSGECFCENPISQKKSLAPSAFRGTIALQSGS